MVEGSARHDREALAAADAIDAEPPPIEGEHPLHPELLGKDHEGGVREVHGQVGIPAHELLAARQAVQALRDERRTLPEKEVGSTRCPQDRAWSRAAFGTLAPGLAYIRKTTLCPPIKDFTLARPKKGTDSLEIVAAGTASQSFVGTPLDVTVGMGGQCTSGTPPTCADLTY